MEHPATRSNARRLLGQLTQSARRSLTRTAICFVCAYLAAYIPTYSGLAPPAVSALFILLFCAGLWIAEAVPAFSVSLLAIALSIALIGRDETGAADWEKYVTTWGSPLIWLFFAGFILAAAAKKTGLDLWMAGQVLGRLGKRPAFVLLGVMIATAVLSMFLSNTATATMMVAMLQPALATSNNGKSYAKALLLGVAVAANVGGMGTLIGTPPNAIAAGTLKDFGGIDFMQWMWLGVPPAMILLVIGWGYLMLRYLGRAAFEPAEKVSAIGEPPAVPQIQQLLVMFTFSATILMWMTSPWHGIPTTVVSFFPICVLTTTGTLDRDDLQTISWDVLLLIAGGLSLGVAITDTGLADWIVTQLPLDNLGPVVVAFCLAYVAMLLSNLMSNTAAANVILPIAIALLGSENAHFVVPIALSASAAMCLPISTPPNAIVYGTGLLKTKDLIVAGLAIGIVAPPIVILWTKIAS